MSNLTFLAQKFDAFSAASAAAQKPAMSHRTRPGAPRKPLARAVVAALILLLAAAAAGQAQTATVNWTETHQVIDGFGASDAFLVQSMSSANQALFFGTGPGQLGLSLLRVAVANGGSSAAGDCSSVGTSCAGPFVGDMQAVVAHGGRVYASPWSPPAAYTTNGSVNCSAGSGNGKLSTSKYAAYATWLANYVQSLKAQGINLYALSVQNEPDMCMSYDSALWSGSDIDTFVKTNLGPTFASNGLSTLIFVPEGSSYSAMTNLGSTCGGDSSCAQYVGGFNWHEYSGSLSGTNTVAANPYPSGWAAGKKYWETEASCGNGFGPNFCQSGFNLNITDALDWAAVIDQRIAVDGANAWLYWWLTEGSPSDDESLTDAGSQVAKRAYMLGQYSKFVRPGYYRVGATHLPQSGVSVSAYKNTDTNALVIIATNYTGSPVSQQFTLTNAPAFSTVTPTTTSASLSLAEQPHVSVSNSSFTYTLPANSITTFVGSAAEPSPPTNLTGTVLQ
jgi:glucuronoarabinoxylan endo-1,4-beta-xylanase